MFFCEFWYFLKKSYSIEPLQATAYEVSLVLFLFFFDMVYLTNMHKVYIICFSLISRKSYVSTEIFLAYWCQIKGKQKMK